MSIRILGSFQHAEKAEEKRMQLHVVLAQVTPNEMGKGDVRAILPRMRELTEIAARQGADVIVFPEYFLTGSSHEAWHQVRWHDPINSKEEDPDWLAIIQEMARTNEIAIVTGSAVVLHDDDPTQQLYNITYFIDYRGRIRGSYTKRHLWHAERAILSNATDESHPAKDYPPLFLFKTKRGLKLRASMLMCWDLMFPESFRRLLSAPGRFSSDLDEKDRFAGPDVVFAPTCWYADDSGPRALAWNKNCEAACLDAVCVSRAMENECFVCMCNAAGPSTGSPRGLGHSSCNAPLLGCSARVEDEKEALLFHTLPIEAMLTARDIFKIRHDMGTGILSMPMVPVPADKEDDS